MFKRNGGKKAHIMGRIRQAGIVMKGVWGTGNRKFGKDWRMWLFGAGWRRMSAKGGME